MAPRAAADDSHLDELVQRKDYKQALSLIEKRIKKGSKSDILLTLLGETRAKENSTLSSTVLLQSRVPELYKYCKPSLNQGTIMTRGYNPCGRKQYKLPLKTKVYVKSGLRPDSRQETSGVHRK
ncbi:MAG: hypothetical protein Q9167_000766 [Letrouitia subvulpina]